MIDKEILDIAQELLFDLVKDVTEYETSLRMIAGTLRENQWLCQHPDVDSWYLLRESSGRQRWVGPDRASRFDTESKNSNPLLVWVCDKEALERAIEKTLGLMEKLGKSGLQISEEMEED